MRPDLDTLAQQVAALTAERDRLEKTARNLAACVCAVLDDPVNPTAWAELTLRTARACDEPLADLHADAARICRAIAERDRLRMDLQGHVKALALLNAGMESLSEDRDALKQRARQAEADRDQLRAALEGE